MNEFEKLGLDADICKALERKGIDKPTPIQEKSIPLVLKGQDLIAESATGSGKTLAFGLGVIQNIEPTGKIKAVVLTPTRELAEQVCQSLHLASKLKRLRVVAVYGGVSINPQIDNLRNADIVVATPGRMLDHLDRRTIDLSQLRTLILDEADRMADMGFIKDVEHIIKQCPQENRQTLLFSATISNEINAISRKYMNNPQKVSTAIYVDPKKLKQIYMDVKDNMKISLLAHLLQQENQGLVMVFANTRRNVDFIVHNMKGTGVRAVGIHGGLTQAKRNTVMKNFHSGRVTVLVCTDVAARGLDIPDVSHVYNYDLPADSKDYVHRAGRTARAGKEGKVVNLLSSRDHENFTRILRSVDMNIVKDKTPFVERIVVQKPLDKEMGVNPHRNHGRGRTGGPRHSGPRSSGPRRSFNRGPRREGQSEGGRSSRSE